MSRIKTISLLGFILVLVSAQGAFGVSENEFLGRWAIMIDDSGTTFNACWLEVNRGENGLSGSLLWRWGSVTPVKSIKLVGDELQVVRSEGYKKKTYDVVYRATLRYDRLVGTVKKPDGSVRHFCGQRVPQPPVDVSGTWDLNIQMGKQSLPHELALLQKGEKITGFFGMRNSFDEIRQAKLDGNHLTLTLTPQPISGHEAKMELNLEFRGDRVLGTGRVGSAQEYRITGQRRHVWGTPIELFDGKDLSNWLSRDPKAIMKWYVEDGVMATSPPGTDIYTRRVFDDFKLHVEFKLSKGANSGIYVRGRYEVQVLDDYGKGVESHGMGAIYSRVPPIKNATKPAGEWQVYDITLIGRWITVVLNGQTIIDNQYLDGITGGALDSFEWMSGPIMLQDHGDRVWYRKVTLTPMIK